MTTDRERLAEARALLETFAAGFSHISVEEYIMRGEERIPCFIQIETVTDIRAWLAHDEGRDDE